MANLIIPFFETPSFQEEVTLDGIVYSLIISWNSLGAFWVLSIFDRDLNPIILGIKLVLNYELFKMHPKLNSPKGELYVIDIKEGSGTISFEDLTSNGRCQLVYVEPV
jgi:hypothetical protein